MQLTLARRPDVFVVLLAASLVVHAVMLVLMPSSTTVRTVSRPIELAMFEVPARPPAPAPVVKHPPKVARGVSKPRGVATAAPRVAPAVGIAPEAKSEVGVIAVPVGTLFIGKATQGPLVLPKGEPTGEFAAPGTADTEPETIGEVRIDYPPEAKKHDAEGRVRMQVTVDANGVVTKVVVLSGPGFGLNEAAREALLRFKFKPATKGGQPVGATFTYSYLFELN